MAETLEDKIKKFLSISYGYGNGSGNGNGNGSGNGYGNGSGNGYGNGNGYGSGDGDGYGDGEGYGSGNGDGYGDGYGDGDGYGNGDGYGDGDGDGSGSVDGYGNDVKQLNGHTIYKVDGINTLIYSVHGNYAKGAIIEYNVYTKPCFIAKVENFFAHGETLRAALNDVTSKALQNTPIKVRVERFRKEFPDFDKKIDAPILFRWHNILTISCEMGRKSFCESKGVDYENGKYSVNEFLDICKDAYGWENVKLIKGQE